MHFTASPPQPSLARPTLRLGTIRRDGDRALVASDHLCGPLCGSGTTVIVVRNGGRWRVTGNTGLSWIS